MTPPILETERLVLCQLTVDDAPFILGLLNEPSFIRFIADRGVRTLAAAREYIQNGPMASYARHGFGLYLTALKETGEPLGMCGLVRRDGLDDVDLGYAFLPAHWGHGYAFEAAAAVLDYACRVVGLRRLVAIVSVDNDRSIKLLDRLGFQFERMIRLPGDDEEIKLFAWETP
jgi:RimJ/RimL family protein N-acetyltransferase